MDSFAGALHRRLHLQFWFFSGSVFSAWTPLSMSGYLWRSLQPRAGDGQAGGDNLSSARECQERGVNVEQMVGE